MNDCYLSVVIPAFNESKRLPRTFNEIKAWLSKQSFAYEVVVVDDGSKDVTVEICRQAAKDWPELKCFEQGRNIGKGAAVKRGVQEATGQYILMMDADLSTPIDTVNFFLPHMTDHDMVVGVRSFSGEGESSGRFRRIVGLAQQLLAHIIVFQKSVADSQCGFKLFSRECGKDIFSKSCIKGGMFDVELFFIAHKKNYRIFSKPVKWVHQQGSTINILRCILFDPLALFYIRLMDLLGKYN